VQKVISKLSEMPSPHKNRNSRYSWKKQVSKVTLVLQKNLKELAVKL